MYTHTYSYIRIGIITASRSKSWKIVITKYHKQALVVKRQTTNIDNNNDNDNDDDNDNDNDIVSCVNISDEHFNLIRCNTIVAFHAEFR
tara:strand:+ start:408 stop:674 length:267 start_codon:yes stop_codon:yes gene_type:complete